MACASLSRTAALRVDRRALGWRLACGAQGHAHPAPLFWCGFALLAKGVCRGLSCFCKLQNAAHRAVDTHRRPGSRRKRLRNCCFCPPSRSLRSSSYACELHCFAQFCFYSSGIGVIGSWSCFVVFAMRAQFSIHSSRPARTRPGLFTWVRCLLVWLIHLRGVRLLAMSMLPGIMQISVGSHLLRAFGGNFMHHAPCTFSSCPSCAHQLVVGACTYSLVLGWSSCSLLACT